jgi:hypothetical protein
VGEATHFYRKSLLFIQAHGTSKSELSDGRISKRQFQALEQNPSANSNGCIRGKEEITMRDENLRINDGMRSSRGRILWKLEREIEITLRNRTKENKFVLIKSENKG